MDGADRADLLTADDITVGFVAGVLSDSRWPPEADRSTSAEPVAALVAALRHALERPPCAIGFSGGRDSSLLLALAVDEARRAGLALPIPVTLEFDSEQTREREWQELVLSHLRVEDWVRLPQGSDLDLLGPVAADGLLRHGVMYPGNAHMVVPLAAVAPGGSVITGFGGDDVLGEWPFERIAAMVARRRRAHAGDGRALVGWAAPARIRTARYAARREWVQLPWLRPPHDRTVARRIAADMAGSPRTWQARMRWLARRRIWAVAQRAMDRHASAHGARTYAPFVDAGFLTALARAGGRLGLGDRTALMRLLSADLLPPTLVERRTKAAFTESYFGVHTRRFAQNWDGCTGIDPQIVDAAALREEWQSDQPHGLSAALLQSAWLETERGADLTPLDGAPER